MKCIIPCAGESSRMSYVPKHLVKIKGRTLISYVVEAWEGIVDSFVFVLRRNMTYMWEYLPKQSIIVFQDEPKGLADAILQAEKCIEGRFIVALGDCLQKGKFVGASELGVGVWETKDLEELNKSYLVKTRGYYISELLEKPHLNEAPSLGVNCGMGTYFFDSRVFDYIRRCKGPSGGGDLTQVIQDMVDAGEKLAPVWFKGKYINVGSPEDLNKAAEILE